MEREPAAVEKPVAALKNHSFLDVKSTFTKKKKCKRVESINTLTLMQKKDVKDHNRYVSIKLSIDRIGEKEEVDYVDPKMGDHCTFY